MAGPIMGFVDKLEEVLAAKGSKGLAARAAELQPLLSKALLLGLEDAAAIVRLAGEDYRDKGRLAESQGCANAEAQIRARIAQLEKE
ncbi:MAG: hypothetical protein AB7F09_21155 [Parvibaculaceae bacterium]